MEQDLFGPNKQKVREMDTRLIERYFGGRKGSLRYLGLPASPLTDILLWKDYFAHFSAVERGRLPQPYIYQHDLMLTVMRQRLTHKVSLYRGDIDDLLVTRHDDFGSSLQYPYDVVSLDYSGGLVYKDKLGRAKRVEAMQALFSDQAAHDQDFLLLLSSNLDNQDSGEVRKIIDGIGHDLEKLGVNAQENIRAHLGHEREEVRWKIYVPYLIGQLTSQWYQIECFKPIFYDGNLGTRMMHFSMWLSRSAEYVAGRPNRQTLLQILNLSAFQCVNGELHATDFDIPRASSR